MTAVPLCRASQIEPFSSWLEDQGVPARPILKAVGLPTEPLEIANRWVAELPIWRFCDVATRSQGIEDFGLRVGLDTDVASIGAFGRALRAATTLGHALEVFLAELNLHSTSSVFGVRKAGEFVWFWRAGLPGIRSDAVEQYAAGLMIQIVRLAAGSHWLPDRIALQASRVPVELLAAARIDSGAPQTAIRLPGALLAQSLRLAAPDTDDDLSLLRGATAEPDLVGSLRQAIAPVLADGPPGLQWAAEAVNTSERTLKRRLRELGLSWSGLVGQSRFDAARELLANSDLSLGNVGRQVGYSDPANFSRAFRRWTGVPPSRYRSSEGERGA